MTPMVFKCVYHQKLYTDINSFAVFTFRKRSTGRGKSRPCIRRYNFGFSYTSAEDVRLCIEMLNASPDYVTENDRKHHSMSAALNQYYLFIEDWEKRTKNS